MQDIQVTFAKNLKAKPQEDESKLGFGQDLYRSYVPDEVRTGQGLDQPPRGAVWRFFH